MSRRELGLLATLVVAAALIVAGAAVMWGLGVGLMVAGSTVAGIGALLFVDVGGDDT